MRKGLGDAQALTFKRVGGNGVHLTETCNARCDCGEVVHIAAEANVGAWGQGVVWSRDGKTLLAQSMLNRSLDVLSFNGKQLKVVGAIKINGGPAGIGTAER